MSFPHGIAYPSTELQNISFSVIPISSNNSTSASTYSLSFELWLINNLGSLSSFFIIFSLSLSFNKSNFFPSLAASNSFLKFSSIYSSKSFLSNTYLIVAPFFKLYIFNNFPQNWQNSSVFFPSYTVFKFLQYGHWNVYLYLITCSL